jgi:hypothetical protein
MEGRTDISDSIELEDSDIARTKRNSASKAAASSVCFCNGPNWVGVVHTGGPYLLLCGLFCCTPQLIIYDMKYDEGLVNRGVTKCATLTKKPQISN